MSQFIYRAVTAPVRFFVARDAEIAAFGLQPGPILVIMVVNCCKFWRRSRRIVWASGFGVVAVLIAGIVSWLLGRSAVRAIESRNAVTAAAQSAAQRADQMLKRANAIQMLLRTEDRYATDSSGTLDALKIGMQSLALSPTAWGESVVRRGLMLLPAFPDAAMVAVPEVPTIVPRRRPAQVAFGRSGVLAQWSFDDEASNIANALTYRITWPRCRKASSCMRLRHPRPLQPLRRWLDGRGEGVQAPGSAAVCRHGSASRYRAGPDRSLRSWRGDAE